MTGVELCEAVAGRIAALWPERVLYRDFCPADHQRPSGYLYITRDGYASINALLVRWDVEMELELFCSTDAYDISSTEELRREQAKVLEAFPVPTSKSPPHGWRGGPRVFLGWTKSIPAARGRPCL